MKICSKCKIEKSFENFRKDKTTSDGLRCWCKICCKQYNEEYSKKNQQKIKDYKIRHYLDNKLEIQEKRLTKLYNLTLNEYRDILNKQKEKCLICESKFTNINIPYIDHNHTTGKIRGLLCNTCNRALGLFKDNPEILEKAKQYLLK